MLKRIFEVCPAELAGDILENGIVLSGGRAPLRGLPQRLSEEFCVPVRLFKFSLFSVAHGGSSILEDKKLLERYF